MLTDGIADADLKAAERTGGTILLTTSSNPGIYSKMLLNLASCIDIDLQ